MVWRKEQRERRSRVRVCERFSESERSAPKGPTDKGTIQEEVEYPLFQEGSLVVVGGVVVVVVTEKQEHSRVEERESKPRG